MSFARFAGLTVAIPKGGILWNQMTRHEQLSYSVPGVSCEPRAAIDDAGYDVAS